MRINTLPHRKWHNRKQLRELLTDLQAANPGARWTRQKGRMGDGSTLRWEVYKLGGVPIFEVEERPGNEAWNDLRKEPAQCL